MDAEKHLIYLSDKEKTALKKSANSYIYKVPKKLRVSGGGRYDPLVVSIGPYHRENAENLEVTTNLKKHYVNRLLDHNPTPTITLRRMAAKIKDIQAECREYYASSFELEVGEFCNMLLLDACFIIGILCRYQLHRNHEWRNDDLFFNNNSILSSIRRDLILLENQIPYIVLHELFLIIEPHRDRINPDIKTLNQHILSFFEPIFPATLDVNGVREGKHILDLLRNHLVPIQGDQERDEIGTGAHWEHTICATDLEEAGVKFKRKDINTGLLDISFDFQTGKFEIPPFIFGESWTVLFPNMIALEQCHEAYEDRITSYVLIMDYLVDSRSDVKLLKDKGIIAGYSKEYETIANDINNLSKDALYNIFYYDSMCQDVNKFHKRRWPRWRAYFTKYYVHTPWAGVSTGAAILLLLLTVIQTAISIAAWKRPVKTG